MFRYNISNPNEDNVFLRIYIGYYGKHIPLPRYSIKIAFTYDTLKIQPTLEAYIDTYLNIVGKEFMRVLDIELENTNFAEVRADIKKEILNR
jgi:hypothetical protein